MYFRIQSQRSSRGGGPCRTEARDLLDEIERRRRRTRADLGGLWFPLVLFGGITLVSAVVAWGFGPERLGLFWLVTGPAAAVVTSMYYWRHELRVGVESHATPYVMTGAGILAGCFFLGWLGDALGAHTLSSVGPALVVSAGYVVFARLQRAVGLAVVALGLAVVAAALPATGVEPGRAAVILALAYGSVFVATGLAYRAPRSEP